ncbi:hypothetical protein AQUCO_05800222v1 [Aquilegia coerulea]|uniref:Uncharacterized protein n=1 Tax=Aquilegia coerulea TaxID=218851 RepID=A0A2G5CFD4_AQUCA|nr:hypothetical protein AQUCO_05800222v1 [Aquilegia coerulea]
MRSLATSLVKKATILTPLLLSNNNTIVHSTLLLLLKKVCSEPFLFHHPFRFSSFSTAIEKPSSDKRVGGIIQSKLLQAEGLPVPDGFSFQIIDNPGDDSISLQKNFADETIKILVYYPDDDAQVLDGDKSSGMLNISLIVTVVKGDGPCMEFRCRAFHDNVKIQRMLIKGPADSSEEIPYEGPEFL